MLSMFSVVLLSVFILSMLSVVQLSVVILRVAAQAVSEKRFVLSPVCQTSETLETKGNSIF
jgi:hypothetical protein